MTHLVHVEMKPADWAEYWRTHAPQATFRLSGIDRTVAPNLLVDYLSSQIEDAMRRAANAVAGAIYLGTDDPWVAGWRAWGGPKADKRSRKARRKKR